MKAILHCRVSSKEQEETGYSLDAQEKLLREYANSKGLEVSRVFKVSESASGKQIRRMFNEMLQYAVKKKVPVICCEKIDRLTRNLKDAATVNDWVHENKERQVHFIKENFVLSKDTRAHENLVWDMKVAIARFYTNNLSEEVTKGQKEKLAQGWWPGKAPLGYKTIVASGHKTIVPDEVKAAFMKKAFELYSTGNHTLKSLSQTLYKEGLRSNAGRKVTKTRLYDLLTNPFYYGKMKWKGEILRASHKPLITKELFQSVQKQLSRKANYSQYRKHMPVFKGKIRCEECTGLIAWETHKGFWYGHCNHYRPCKTRKWWRQEEVEEGLFSLLGKIAPKSPEVLNAIRIALKEIEKQEVDYNDKAVNELQFASKRAQRRLEMLYDDKLDGKVSQELYELKLKQYTLEQEEALDKLKILTQDRSEYYKAGAAIHELAARSIEIYKSPEASIEDKRLLLSLIFSNFTLNADEIKAEYTLAFQFLADWVPRLNNTFEQDESLTNKRQISQFRTNCSVMWTFKDCFRTYDWYESFADIAEWKKDLKNLLIVVNKRTNLISN